MEGFGTLTRLDDVSSSGKRTLDRADRTEEASAKAIVQHEQG